MENQQSIQEIFFILEYKFHLSESDVYNMERWVAKKRLNLLNDYNEKKAKDMEKDIKENKSSIPSSLRSPHLR